VNELVVSHGNRQVILVPGQAAVIGRGAGSILRVDDPRVSREHLRLSYSPRGWLLESVGQSGTYVSGQPVTQVLLVQAVAAHLAQPDGPLVRFEPAAAPAAPAPGPAAAQAPQWAPPPQPAPFVQPGAPPVMPGGARPAARPGSNVTGESVLSALRMLVPIVSWIRDPAFRQWYRLLVAVYALVPVVMLVLLQHTTSLTTLGWVYCLYVAPLWALVFWFLIRPGHFGRRETVITGVLVVSQLVLIPALTVPWEQALAPASTSTNPLAWTYGVGLAEEFTKAAPVLVIALVLLRRKTKLDVRMWMFLAALSGLMFGVYEASTVYVPLDVVTVAHGFAFGIPEFVERVFLDGLQHALWAGIAGFFIGLGTNYHRQRIPLWIFGLALPSVLHGLNDWSTSGAFGHNLWPWIAIQAFSVFLFLGYTASAASIEREVRHTPIFRGDSMLADRSRLAAPQAPRGAPPAAPQGAPPPG
jgi:RsiW-degrading membrane proteinase PrsW (M82 family)